MLMLTSVGISDGSFNDMFECIHIFKLEETLKYCSHDPGFQNATTLFLFGKNIAIFLIFGLCMKLD